jgi:hypothetical protein
MRDGLTLDYHWDMSVTFLTPMSRPDCALLRGYTAMFSARERIRNEMLLVIGIHAYKKIEKLLWQGC